MLVVYLLLSIFAVSHYGEAEFWFASIKIIAIIGLIVPGGGALRRWLWYWKHGLALPRVQVVGHYGALPGVLDGPASASSLRPNSPPPPRAKPKPRRNIPKATHRLIVFYVPGALVIGAMVRCPRMLQAIKTGGVPFVLGIQRAGLNQRRDPNVVSEGTRGYSRARGRSNSLVVTPQDLRRPPTPRGPRR
jgi:amino acid transporter